MKQTTFTDENGLIWEITIKYMNEEYAFDYNNTGNELVTLKSNTHHLNISYPFIPIGLKFRITPTTITNGIKTYGYLSYDGELVCSFDPTI